MTQKLDSSAVQTVVDLADHMRRLRTSAEQLQQSFETRQRGYFVPSEDDQVLHLWVSYHKSRAALLELIDNVRRRVGRAKEEHLAEFAVAYAAALVLVDAARCLRNLFAENDLVRRKLNESCHSFGIAEGSFDAVQMSLTDPANAIKIKEANEFFDARRGDLDLMAQSDEGLGPVLQVIDRFAEATRVTPARYIRARLGERGHDAHHRVIKGSVERMVYAIQELGSRLVSNISTMPSHVPCIPDEVAREFQSLLRDGDVFVTRKDNAVTNYFLPGYWPHAAMYVGSDRVVESLKDGVHERLMDSPFGNDAVALIRPRLDPIAIKSAIERAGTHVGKPYDFDFDFTRADRLVCTEVVYRSYEGIGGLRFQLTRRAGRETLSAEDLLNLSLQGQAFEQVAVYCPKISQKVLVGMSMTEALRQTMAEPHLA